MAGTKAQKAARIISLDNLNEPLIPDNLPRVDSPEAATTRSARLIVGLWWLLPLSALVLLVPTFVPSFVAPLPSVASFRGIIRLAVSPQCGDYVRDDYFQNFNHGVDMSGIKTIVTFGDSWSDNGRWDGSTPKPARPSGTAPKYGGRMSNGLVWAEDLANQYGAQIKGYAVSGSTVDKSIWPSKVDYDDMVTQVATFLGQHNVLDGSTTLATVFFSINDWSASIKDGNHFPAAARQVLNQTQLIIDYGIKNFLFIGYAFEDARHNYETTIWQGMRRNVETYGVNFAFADWSPVIDALYLRPQDFGFTNTSREGCTKSELTAEFACDEPDKYLYWLPAHPQYQLHRILAEYTDIVLTQCRA